MNGPAESALTDTAAPSQRPANEALLAWAALIVLLGVYAGMALLGYSVFIVKTLILPILIAYGVATRYRVAFLREWAPYLGALLLFDALRGVIFAFVESGARPVFVKYVIAGERWLTGTPALSIPLQSLRVPWLDRLLVAWHGTHFLFFLVFGLAVWHLRRDEFWRYRLTCLIVMYVGVLCYILGPTAPPWVASDRGDIPHIAAISHELYIHIPSILRTALDTNPVAAMPSLHIAFPAACTMLAWQIFGRAVGVSALVYTAVQSFAIVYLGEHYLVDVVAGVGLAVLAYWIARVSVPPPTASLRHALGTAAVLLILTGAIYAVTIRLLR